MVMRPTVLKTIRDYEKGMYILHESIFRLLVTCEPDDLDGLPSDFEEWLWKRVDELPTSEEDWGKLLHIGIVSWVRWNDQIKWDKQQREERENHHVRRVVEALIPSSAA